MNRKRKNINFSKWKKFKIDELFYKVDLKCKKKNFNKSYDTSLIKTDEFSLPLINAKHGNNGIMYYGRQEDFETEEWTIDIVKNGAIATGDVYIQPQKTGILWDAYLIKTKENIKSENVLLFLSTAIYKTIKNKYSYDDKCIWAKVKKESIILPVNCVGQPDLKYMENYISALKKSVNRKIELLTNDYTKMKKINITKWRTFKIKEIFITEKLNNKLQVPTGSYLAKKYLIEDGTTPRITVTNFNNGIYGKYNLKDEKYKNNYRVFNNFISVSFLSTVFYQEKEASLDMKVHCLKPIEIELNKYIGLFLVSVIRSLLKQGTYADQISSTVLPELEIRLPINNQGKPDWIYMEQYIKNIQRKVDKKITYLNQL